MKSCKFRLKTFYWIGPSLKNQWVSSPFIFKKISVWKMNLGWLRFKQKTILPHSSLFWTRNLRMIIQVIYHCAEAIYLKVKATIRTEHTPCTKYFYYQLGNCDKFYFTFQFEVQMWLWIYQIFERHQIPIYHLWNKSNLNTAWTKIFELDWISSNRWKTEIKLFIISHKLSWFLISCHNFSVNIVFYCIYLQLYHSNFTR